VTRTPLDLSDSVALVTGGGTGIGQAIALTLADCGAIVVVASRRAHHLVQTVEEIEAGGHVAWARTTDVRDTGQCRQLVHDVVDRYGRLDVLVNNAGGSKSFAFETWTDDEINNSIALNMRSVFVLSQEAAVAMAARKSGNIVNISSIASAVAMPGLGPYGMAKAGVISLTRTMAARYGPDGIRVNSICVGFVKSDGLRRAMDTMGRDPDEVAGECNALRRAGSLREVAEPLLFLVSPGASFISGETINVTGGPPVVGPW
jgi:3-oxoacyl-[acyl-carrier protein] reductase